jgi:poly(A) polymerase
VTAPLAEALAAAPAVRVCREALGDSDGAWVVGGAIRDAALGREVTDVDLAVGGDERGAAEAIARAVGGPCFQLSDEFATWRVLAADGAWHVDVARLRDDSIQADLALRDFTVNSVAIELADLEATPLDPTGGLADLDDRVLRAVSEHSFIDDPLRVLRGARIAAEVPLEVEPATAGLARAAAGRVVETAGERQLAELRLVLTGPDPIRGLSLLDELGATPVVLPELEASRGVEQNPNHHLDVHGHTVEVLRNVLAIEAELDTYAGERAGEVSELLAEPLADGLTRSGALRFGALVHDLGKPATRRVQGGYVTFIGHDREGVEIVAGLSRRLKTSRRLERHLQGLTLHHLRLGFLVHERPLPRRRVYEYLRDTDPVAADVTLLSAADRLAARGGGAIAGPEMVEAHLDLAREMLAAALDWRRDGPPRAPIRGDELAAALEIEQGPELGRLLGEIEAEVYAGEVSSREDAIALGRRLIQR